MVPVVIILGLLCVLLMELNKNSILGPILAVCASAEFLFIFPRLFAGKGLPVQIMAWACFLLCLLIAFYITKASAKRHPAVDEKDPKTTKVRTVEQGQLIGVYTADKKVEIYAGIPYAKPPIGDLRWKEPEDPEPWEGVFKADHYAPMSMQKQTPEIINSLGRLIAYHEIPFSIKGTPKELASEDSLYLNVWKPAGEQNKLPVLVYIHGGSLTNGQTWFREHSGEGLARREIVVVSMAYRLGVFGFYADPELQEESPNHTTGNYGLLDQIKALEWVKKNIEAFGGDPDNVTIAGESAGSACVTALCTSPLAKGLFHRAIGESSTVTSPRPMHSYRSLEEAFETAKKLKTQMKADTVKDLRKVKAEKLVEGTKDNHHITVDGYVLTESPYESYKRGIHNEEAILHGFNRDEGRLFVLGSRINEKKYKENLQQLFGNEADQVLEIEPVEPKATLKDRWVDVFSTVFFTYGHYCWTRQALANEIPVYQYYFTKENRQAGPNHAGEMIYCYGMIPEASKKYDASDRDLSEKMNRYFANFITYGDPNGSDLPDWEKATGTEHILEFGSKIRETSDPFAALYPILDRVQGWDQKVSASEDTEEIGSIREDDPVSDEE